MITLYQYCDKCKTERNFNPESLECIVCNHKNKKNGENSKKN